MTDKYTPVIPKERLRDGAYYRGRCRNAEEARWNGKEQQFYHWRTKFGDTFIETIRAPEDDAHYDVFVAEEEIAAPKRAIPFDQGEAMTDCVCGHTQSNHLGAVAPPNRKWPACSVKGCNCRNYQPPPPEPDDRIQKKAEEEAAKAIAQMLQLIEGERDEDCLMAALLRMAEFTAEECAVIVDEHLLNASVPAKERKLVNPNLEMARDTIRERFGRKP